MPTHAIHALKRTSLAVIWSEKKLFWKLFFQNTATIEFGFHAPFFNLVLEESHLNLAIGLQFDSSAHLSWTLFTRRVYAAISGEVLILNSARRFSSFSWMNPTRGPWRKDGNSTDWILALNYSTQIRAKFIHLIVLFL